VYNEHNDEGEGRPLTTTTTTPTRMSLSELTSPSERMKRRRLISIAMDDIQYQLVRSYYIAYDFSWCSSPIQGSNQSFPKIYDHVAIYGTNSCTFSIFIITTPPFHQQNTRATYQIYH
jgi:hypothetical protein